MLIRSAIYAMMPVRYYHEWFIRDMVMTAPRGLVLIFSLLALRGMSGTFWLGLKSMKSAVILVAVLAGEIAAIFSFKWNLPFNNYMALIGWTTTLFVSFFEETCFRGLLFSALKERMSPLKAAILGSVIFTVYHYQAQPILTWPGIFLVGFCFCAAYYSGAGIIWLVLIHELIDGLYLHVANMERVYLYVLGYIILALCAIYSASILLRHSPITVTQNQ